MRFTQDSPILPNVWLAFANNPRSQQELILTTTNNSGTGEAAAVLRKMLANLRKKRPQVGEENPEPRLRARVAYIPGQIAVKLYFDELMRVVLPLTPWWHETYDTLRKLERFYQEADNAVASGPGVSNQITSSDLADPAEWKPFPQPDSEKKRERDFVDSLMEMRREIDPSVIDQKSGTQNGLPGKLRVDYVRQIPHDLSWLVRISGVIADCFSRGAELLDGKNSLAEKLNQDFLARKHLGIETQMERDKRLEQKRASYKAAKAARESIVQSFVGLYDNWSSPTEYPNGRFIWRVTKNRRVNLAVAKSALTVKADAARRLFDISCDKITWAVLDSGIDSRHPAFNLTSEKHEREIRRQLKAGRDLDLEKGREKGDVSKSTTFETALETSSEIDDNYSPVIRIEDLGTRIVKTLDFTKLRDLLDFEVDDKDIDAPERENRVKNDIASRLARNETHSEEKGQPIEAATELFEELRRKIEAGKDIDWQDLQRAIEVHDAPAPTNDHGTHVAGILAADWIEDIPAERDLPLALRTRSMQGVCPDINLIDVRVFREDGLTDEFELVAALQYLRWMNSRAGTMQVHGANLSLSLVHEVRRFACGQTPICDECNEAVAAGMVVVAAAGNRGFEMDELDQVRASDEFKSVSITDPGNADKVITVGATHRKRPHEYGVSYFSSRGPTGDGRLKPDVVAPGEKIRGPTPNGRAEYKDGTSMAAPHVSGIAAMLMARHTELIAKPEQIKEILCETATDLGRERYFQGHGLVDALRALQSV